MLFLGWLDVSLVLLYLILTWLECSIASLVGLIALPDLISRNNLCCFFFPF